METFALQKAEEAACPTRSFVSVQFYQHGTGESSAFVWFEWLANLRCLCVHRRVFAMQASYLPHNSLDHLIRVLPELPCHWSHPYLTLFFGCSILNLWSMPPQLCQFPVLALLAFAYLTETAKHLIRWRIMSCCSVSHFWFTQLSSLLLY